MSAAGSVSVDRSGENRAPVRPMQRRLIGSERGGAKYVTGSGMSGRARPQGGRQMAQVESVNTRDGDVDPAETAEWLESLQYVLETKGPDRVRYLLSDARTRTAYRQGVQLPFSSNTPYINTDPGRSAAGLSRQSRDRTAHQKLHPLERHGDGRARQSRSSRDRRPHLDLRLGGHAVRGGVQSFLPRNGPGLLSGTRFAGHLRPRVSGRTTHRRAD